MNMNMALQRHIAPFIIIVLSFIVSCYSRRHDYSPNNYGIREESGYDFQAYPSYFSTIEDGKFSSIAQLQAGMLTLKKFGRRAASVKTVNVDDFGAKGDGSTDDTEAFRKAWMEACSSAAAVFVVPMDKKYLLKPIRFSGPCKSDLTVEIYGTIEASNDRSDYQKDRRHWLIFDRVQNLVVEGGGIINGNGKIWWENSCKINKALPCKDAPTALTFYKCKNLNVKNLKIQDAQQIQVSFDTCVNVQASDLIVTAPEASPNTDGIHVTNTQNIQISGCVIGTGDDCISIASGSQKVHASDITCGPGHGISIGSLGSADSKAYVSDVTVDGAKLSGTQNGVRIKTWQGGSGSASNIKFQNIDVDNVENPIIIDQEYCDRAKPCKQESSAVQVKNVLYQNIKGTSASNVAIKFDCSKNFPCEEIQLQDINLVLEGGEAVKALCNNVELNEIGDVSPQCP